MGMFPDVHRYITAAWFAAAIVWLVGALSAKPTERRQTASSRIFQTLFFVLAFILLFQTKLNSGHLGVRILPDTAATAYLGLILTVAGVAFAIWARLYLGGNWSAAITTKLGHTL